MTTINRKYKDSLFCRLFGSEDYKHYALELYNALAGTNHRNPAEIEIMTIENTVYLGFKNDVSYLVGDEMMLLEHQSTSNPNMPLRGLLNFSKLYAKHIEKHDCDLYGTKLVKLPTPRFIVLSFSSDSTLDCQTQRLSDSFATGPGDIEVTVTVLNCNEGRNLDIMEACEALRGYAHLLALGREFRKSAGMDIESAVKAAVAQCIEEGVLVDYLTEHRMEAEDMLFTIEDEERAMRVHWEAVEREAREVGLEAGRKEGREEGREEGLKEGREEGRNDALAESIEKLRAAGFDEAADLLANNQ